MIVTVYMHDVISLPASIRARGLLVSSHANALQASRDQARNDSKDLHADRRRRRWIASKRRYHAAFERSCTARHCLVFA